MMHRAWSSIVEVPYCFSRPYVKFQGHTALKIVEFDPNWAFPDCNSSLNSPMAMKCCTKLETAKERCPIVFQGHPSNFKVTRYKTSPILAQIGRFQTIGQSQLQIPQICLVRGFMWLIFISSKVLHQRPRDKHTLFSIQCTPGLYCILFSPNDSQKTPIAIPLGQGMVVFREFLVWPTFYLGIYCVMCSIVLYCTKIYQESKVPVQ